MDAGSSFFAPPKKAAGTQLQHNHISTRSPELTLYRSAVV
jgi:hypothetical protein